MLRVNRKYLLAEVLVAAALLALLAIPLMHMLRQARWQMHERQEVTCFNHQKQIAYAALLWAQEHGDTLPPAATCWRELALPKEVLRCPAARFQRYGYVYSTRVAGKALSDIPDPVVSLLTGDGKSEDHLAHTATDFVPRHSSLMVASYADGHVCLTVPPSGELLVAGVRRDGDAAIQLLATGCDGRILRALGKDAEIRDPACAPAGQPIAFTNARGLYLMSLYRSGDFDKRLLLGNANGARYRCPQWSADGQLLVLCYTSNAWKGIWRLAYLSLKERRSRPHLLTGTDLDCSSPTCSPDGRTIVFAAAPPNHPTSGTLYRVNIDGTGLQRLSGEHGDMPCFSPDGRQLVFITPVGTRPSLRYELRVSVKDGGQSRCLLSMPTPMCYPQFSPDGHTIAFAVATDRRGTQPIIHLFDLNTHRQRKLTAINTHYVVSPFRGFCWLNW